MIRNYNEWNFYKAPSKALPDRYDILAVSSKEKKYEIYKNSPLEIPILEKDDYTYSDHLLLSIDELNDMIIRLKRERFKCNLREDLIDYPDKWQRFYCTAALPENEDGFFLVDQIEIDIESKQYLVLRNERDWVTDGCDIFDEPIYSYYVGRKMLEFLIEACKGAGFKEIKNN